MTSKNFTILTTHEHSPAAAFDLLTTTYGVNYGFERNYFLTYATFAGGNSLALTTYLNPSKTAINAFGSFMTFCAAFQSNALGFFVALSESISLKKPDNNQIVAPKTYGTPTGGLANDFAVWKSFFSIELSASSACLTKGPAS
jgi:hypothetical protein